MVWTDLFQGLIMMTGLGVILGRGTYLAGGVSRVWEINVATGRVEWANWDPSPFSRNTSLGIFCGQVIMNCILHYERTMLLTWNLFFSITYLTLKSCVLFSVNLQEMIVNKQMYV